MSSRMPSTDSATSLSASIMLDGTDVQCEDESVNVTRWKRYATSRWEVIVRRIIAVAAILSVVPCLTCSTLSAEERPLQLSLFPPLQIFPEEDSITLIRFNVIYGRNASVRGLDLGLVNHTTTGMSKGFQWGFASWNDADFTGWQWSPICVTKGDFKGLQLGTVNYARSARGLQLGFVNYAETMYGLQIGLVNIIGEGGFFPVFPIVNWSF